MKGTSLLAALTLWVTFVGTHARARTNHAGDNDGALRDTRRLGGHHIAATAVREGVAPRVVGGEFTTPQDSNDNPWVVELLYGGSPGGNFFNRGFCAGSLISPNVVLSAAHCLEDGDQPNFIVAGIWNLNQKESRTEEVRIRSIVRHPGYNSRTLENDIGLIFLDSDVTRAIPPLAIDDLPFSQSAHVGETGKIMGWGSVDVDCRQYDPNQKKADVPIVNPNKCVSSESEKDQFVCAGFRGGGTEEAELGCGDSGGPMFIVKNEKPMQVGINSWGFGDSFNGYTRISFYMDFIMNSIDSQKATRPQVGVSNNPVPGPPPSPEPSASPEPTPSNPLDPSAPQLNPDASSDEGFSTTVIIALGGAGAIAGAGFLSFLIVRSRSGSHAGPWPNSGLMVTASAVPEQLEGSKRPQPFYV